MKDAKTGTVTTLASQSDGAPGPVGPARATRYTRDPDYAGLPIEPQFTSSM